MGVTPILFLWVQGLNNHHLTSNLLHEDEEQRPGPRQRARQDHLVVKTRGLRLIEEYGGEVVVVDLEVQEEGK